MKRFTGPTDHELIQTILNPDSTKRTVNLAYNDLYKRYSPVMCFFIQKFAYGLGNFDIEELHSQTMAKALQKLHQYDPKYPFPIWLKSIARNNLTDFLRQRKPPVYPLENLEIISNDSPDRFLEAKQANRRIEIFIDAQDVRLKNVLRLRYQGMKYAEISKCLGLPMGTISTILFRSRNRFRLMM